ncbi:RDD family protein [Rheinheimera muenzenbergensis]|uniref:RDD family protein n=1 Tax=Rheinheimera muenzenbergensis TaxID=1193628 RepID=A0ABU8C365_9GAMM
MNTTEPTPIKHSIHLTEIAPDTFIDANGRQLSAKEVRNIVTPHDFNVASSLFGCALARPWRRGLAMAIDALLITLLAGGGLMFVTPLYAYLVWRCHRLGNPKRRNILLLLLPLVLVFADNQSADKDSTDNTTVNVIDAISISAAAVKIQSNNCDAVCAEAQSDLLIKSLLNQNFTDEHATTSLRDLLEESALSEQQQQQKLDSLKQQRAELAAAQQLLATQQQAEPAPLPEPGWWQKLQQSDHSVIKWIEGIMADLGISFGWAVAYLTLFISWNNGQTPGKRLLGIRVVQLDNKPLSLWGAFGRQGGYSAGFATGLLGFLQIYWDPNRQAIQDKLADTLVLRLKQQP